MIALLITVDYPPNKGGVSRYYEGLVEVSESRIGVAGVDLGEKPPAGNGIRSRIRQILWAKKIIKQVPKNISILIGQPHLGQPRSHGPPFARARSASGCYGPSIFQRSRAVPFRGASAG